MNARHLDPPPDTVPTDWPDLAVTDDPSRDALDAVAAMYDRVAQHPSMLDDARRAAALLADVYRHDMPAHALFGVLGSSTPARLEVIGRVSRIAHTAWLANLERQLHEREEDHDG